VGLEVHCLDYSVGSPKLVSGTINTVAGNEVFLTVTRPVENWPGAVVHQKLATPIPLDEVFATKGEAELNLAVARMMRGEEEQTDNEPAQPQDNV
jgi:hypothetical protein